MADYPEIGIPADAIVAVHSATVTHMPAAMTDALLDTESGNPIGPAFLVAFFGVNITGGWRQQGAYFLRFIDAAHVVAGVLHGVDQLGSDEATVFRSLLDQFGAKFRDNPVPPPKPGVD